MASETSRIVAAMASAIDVPAFFISSRIAGSRNVSPIVVKPASSASPS